MGRIVAPYGVQGWVKIQPQTEEVDGLLSYPTWWLARDQGWQECKVSEGRAHGATLVARLEGCDDRDRALALRGLKVAVPRRELPAPEDGEYYWCDLIGLQVENIHGDRLGQIEDVFATGANDVLVVRGDRERLIPFIGPVVISVEFENSRVVVDWGLDF